MLKEDNERQKRERQFGIYLTIPFVLAIPPVLGWFIGGWIDEHLGTTPYLSYFLLVMGIIAGFRELYRMIKRFGDGI